MYAATFSSDPKFPTFESHQLGSSEFAFLDHQARGLDTGVCISNRAKTTRILKGLLLTLTLGLLRTTNSPVHVPLIVTRFELLNFLNKNSNTTTEIQGTKRISLLNSTS